LFVKHRTNNEQRATGNESKETMRKYIVFALALIAVSMVAGGAYCEGQPDESQLMTLEGAVTKVDVAASQMTVNGGIDMTFPITNETKFITSDGYNTEFSRLRVGDYVNVVYYQDDSGAIKTLRVEVDFTKKDANKGWDEGALYKGGKEW
jgi:hypothetical protein